MGENDRTKTDYVYGPVPSRRLGLSLGVDIVPAKICTLDCLYCQLGRTTEKSTDRRDFLDIKAVLAELRGKLAEGITATYVTIGGSGEPTLHLRLGDLIDGIRKLTEIPVAILTNGTLLWREDVRAECAKADVVIPSLDAGDAATFEMVNRPAADISIEKLVSGLVQFRQAFSGRIWLEVFFIPGVNTHREQIEQIKALIGEIRPDKVHLNTAVRPAAEEGIEPVTRARLDEIAKGLGGGCEVVADTPVGLGDRHLERAAADVVSMLKRRPCSVQDLCAGLGMTPNEAVKHVTRLQSMGLVTSERRRGTTYFMCTQAS